MTPTRALSAIALLLAAAAPAKAADPKPLKALLVLGGCCHDYARQKDIIAKGLAERAHMEVTVALQGGTGTGSKIELYRKPGWADGYDVVLHDECFADVKDSAWIDGILAPHKAGTPAVAIHCAMHCYRDGSDRWFEFLGVTSRRHGAAYAHEVLNRDADHPIMKGFGPAWANPAGELYWVEKVWPSAHVLASSKNKENGHDEACVWTNRYGKARVFGTTLGHHNETVGNPAFLDLLTRGTLWACGKLDPAYLKPVAPRTAMVNVARGKAATASTEEVGKGNFAARAVDGDASTRWCASGPDAPQWLQIDLGKPAKLAAIRLDWESADALYRSKVEGSVDGQSWRTLIDDSAEGRASAQRPLPPGESRYVRVTYLGSGAGGWASLSEVELFDGTTTTVDVTQTHGDAASMALLATVKVPGGFEAKVFAAPPAVNYPVFVAATPGGTLYVSSDKNGSLDREPHRGSVIRLRDVDGDGRADEAKYFVPDVDSPRGLVWDRDRLYLMHPPHLSAFIDHDGDGVADEQKVLVKDIAFGFKDRPADHTSNGVTLGVDGWLYLAIGDFGFREATGADGRKVQLRGGGVARVRPDGSNLEIYARGTRNILEVALDPLLNGFARDNTNDGGGWDIRLHHFSGLEDHGYPGLFRNFADEAVAPLADYGGGSGCGALYLSEPGFPAGFGDAIYTADWGRDRIFRHKPTPKGATFAADQTEFLTLPRVTDLDVDALGHVYATSWKGATFTYAGEDVGFVVRVTPEGLKPAPLPDFAGLDAPGLVGLLRSPSHRIRLEAQRDLIGRNLVREARADLEALAGNRRAGMPTRVAALWALKQGLGRSATPFLAGLAGDATIVRHALRALTDRPEELDVPSGPILAALKFPDAQDRRQAVECLARLRRPEHAPAVAALLGDPDPVVRHTAVRALIALGAVEPCFAVIDRPDATAAERTGALRVVQALHDPAAADGLIRRLDAESDPTRRAGLLAALCRLDRREGTWKGDSWGTRPDTSGPYYQPEPWGDSPKIEAALKLALDRAKGEEFSALLHHLDLHKIKLGSANDLVLNRASADPALLPAAIAHLARGVDLSEAAVPILIKAASGDGPAAVRSLATVALAKSPDGAAMRAVLASLARLESEGRDRPGFREARDAFLKSPSLAGHTPMFSELLADPAGPESAWAAAALLTLASEPRKKTPNVSRDVQYGWLDPARRVRMLHAVALIGHRASAEQVLSALVDPDPAVASAAADAARALKLDPKGKAGRGDGPKIETLAVDRALDAAVAAKGDRSVGAELFARVGCVNCHTVKGDDPPRGPYLGNIAATYKRRDLAEAILLPSKAIAQGFTTNLFALHDGRTLTGFVVREAADTVTIRDADGKEMEIPTSQIDERATQATSVMPEGLVRPLTVREFASLLDYLESPAK